jgi:hypothetical protein
VEVLEDTLKEVLLSKDDSRENQTSVDITALNGLPPCSNSTAVPFSQPSMGATLSTNLTESSVEGLISAQVFDTIISYEMIMSYEISTIISYSGDQDLAAEQKKLTNEIVDALPLNLLQAAFQIPELEAVLGEATLGKVSIENNTGTGENIVDTAVRILCFVL